MASQRNVRFWAHMHESLVKLTIRPDQQLNWHVFERTDEGWAALEVLFEYTSNEDTGKPELLVFGYGKEKDCDGLSIRTWELRADADPGTFVDLDLEGKVKGPDWRQLTNTYNDLAAEQAGY